MHLEYRALLLACYSALHGPEAADALRDYGSFQVTRAPAEANAVLTSNFALKNAPPGRALELADGIVRVYRENCADQWFHLEVAGPGFLNATPTPRFISRFVNHAARSADTLYSSESFIIAPGQTIFQSPKDLSVFSVRWSDVGQKLGPSYPERLMALALLADEELDTQAFLKGIFARENIPWYLNHFLERSADLGRRMRQASTEANCELELPDYAWDQVWALLQFRGELLVSRYGRRPELLVGSVVRMSRAFFRAYNRPGYRALLAQGENRRIAQVIEITNALHGVVAHALTMIMHSCQGENIVLQVDK